MTATMQLLAKMKRKNSAEKTGVPITANNVGSTTNIVDPKPAKPSSPRSGFLVFKPKSPPTPPSPAIPLTPPPAYTATTSPPDAATPTAQRRAGQTTGTAQSTSPSNPPQPSQQQRPLVRVPSVLYCPVLEKNGRGYGNEEARQSTVL